MGIINFLKELFGFETKENGFIGLSQFNNAKTFNKKLSPEKVFVKKEPTLTQLLKRANY